MRGSRPVIYETEAEDGRVDTVIVAEDGDGLWYWSRRSSNGHRIARSEEGYSRKDAGLRAARRTNPPKPRIR